MAVIHKICGTELISSVRGDFGVCPKCNIDVHHLRMENGEVKTSDEVVIIW